MRRILTVLNPVYAVSVALNPPERNTSTNSAINSPIWVLSIKKNDYPPALKMI